MKNTDSHVEMKTMVSMLDHLIVKGYTEDYKVNNLGLLALKQSKVYQPDQVKIANFYRFEGLSDPADESILYAIETDDGGKGTLVDSFGPESDPQVETFIKKVTEITKVVGGEIVKK